MSAATGATRVYRICFYVGDNPPVIPGVRVVDLNMAEVDPAAALTAFETHGLTPADMCAGVVFLADGPIQQAAAAYALVVGFTVRLLDIAQDAALTQIIAAEKLATMVEAFENAGRENAPRIIQVGTPHPVLPTIDATADLTPQDVSALRFADQVRFAPANTLSPLSMLAQLVAILGARRRGGAERFPVLCVGDEPIDAGSPGIDLEAFRRVGATTRYGTRQEWAQSIAPAMLPSPANRTRMLAAAQPVHEVLAALHALPRTEVLPSDREEDGQLWFCPRTFSHPAAPEPLVVHDNKVSCRTCDSELIDPLRLVIEMHRCSVDEAASWLLERRTEAAVA